jgi:PHD/YefM family antitoxin component YafN of YafNO toxin-antitoxin module
MQTIQNYVPITMAKTKLLTIVKSLHDSDDTFAITKKGVPEAILMSMGKFEGLLETIEILADSEGMDQLRNSIEDAKHDRWVEMDEVL